jgi:hypothetical protein
MFHPLAKIANVRVGKPRNTKFMTYLKKKT